MAGGVLSAAGEGQGGGGQGARCGHGKRLGRCSECGNVPAGKDAVHPKAGYVVKTHKTDKDKKPEKVWVNIVHHEKVDEPTSAGTEAGSRRPRRRRSRTAPRG